MVMKTDVKPVIVALDFPDEQKALEFLAQFGEDKSIYLKVGMELFYSAGPQFIRKLKEQGYSLFVDLKLHDIPNTVKSASTVLTKLGVDMFNVHVAGGSKMMKAAREGVEAGLQPGQMRPLLIGVTHLTSTSQQMLNDEIGIEMEIEQAVVRYAALAKQSGLDGVVCSPLEVPSIKAECGSDFVTVTPGIRPSETEKGDQERTTTPTQAKELNTDYIVVGRPITKADSPTGAYKDIVAAFID